MFNTLNEQLKDLGIKRRDQERLIRAIDETETRLDYERQRLQELAPILKKEGADVDRLERPSIVGLFYTLLGDRDLEIKKEREEYLRAKLNYGQCEQSISILESEIESLRERLLQSGDLDGQYKKALEEKARLLAQVDADKARHLEAIYLQITNLQIQIREIEEAIKSGQAVIENLALVVESLQSARNWGTWDIIGGGIIATSMKHSRIDQARKRIAQVQADFCRFQRELADVVSNADMRLEIDSVATFADYFLDSVIFDWVVQSRINESLERVEEVKRRVETMVGNLQRDLGELCARAVSLGERRNRMLELA